MEQIAVRESERTAQEEVVSKVKAEHDEIMQQGRQIDFKVEQVSARVEELRVSRVTFQSHSCKFHL